VIPKQIRDDLGLRPGSVVRIEKRGEEVCLTPVEEEQGLVVKEGVLVYSGAARGNLEEVVTELRGERFEKVVRRGKR